MSAMTRRDGSFEALARAALRCDLNSMDAARPFALVIAALLTAGCSSASPEADEPLAPGEALGAGDGTAGSVHLEVLFASDHPLEPTALAFDPYRPGELWIVNRATDSVTTLRDVGTSKQSSSERHDPAAVHFMHLPTSIAFGALSSQWGGTWATCGDHNNEFTAKGAVADNAFTGPTLFSDDPDVFAKATPDGLGSHLDMLHESSFCMGIAHEKANVYWVFDGEHSALVRYDFKKDHGPGHDDHDDGFIEQYVTGEVKRVPGVSSHLAWEDDRLYVADTGNQRIAVLDTTSGTQGKNLQRREMLEAYYAVDGAVLSDLVPAGALDAPSGLALDRGFLYVTDRATGVIHAFDAASGEETQTLDTGLGAGALAGITIGPDGKAYFVDSNASRVYRVDP